LRVTDVEQKNLSTLHGAQSDVLIAPDTAAFPFDDFSQAAALIDVGREAAEQALPQLKESLADRFGSVGRISPAMSESLDGPSLRRAA
ncbi:MAG: hypothetical protein MJA83_17940, partial [Gammaproteobacteria bacterium]|nr:hypothetical protein [Gammaproteobacteria bacterium]